ncbi:hypothetical protein M3598_01170 [Cytobacillus oceanisediminis]|uniref:hypothetical protein n=1 Tax=Cytobacillus oceanisediminis TaxID=665099 RepID=UPI0020400091|nr:hypothetical protein [Cytobacillus oceanisediminis]MCM3241341.1 hypothetical protein [Cytobacillus oceanisediminis]
MKELVISVVGLVLVLLIVKTGFNGLLMTLGNITAASALTLSLFFSIPSSGKEKDFGPVMAACAVMLIFFSWLFVKVNLVSWFI